METQFFIFMARSRASKKEILTSLKEKIGRSQSVMFASIQGLKVKETESLRKSAREQNAECFVAKKTLLALAFKEHGSDTIDFKKLDGEVAATFGYEDEIAPAKILAAFGKTHERLKILGGLMLQTHAGKQALTAQAVVQLAQLPSRDELRGKLVGTLVNPLRGFVTVLNGNISGLVRVLNGIAQSKT